MATLFFFLQEKLRLVLLWRQNKSIGGRYASTVKALSLRICFITNQAVRDVGEEIIHEESGHAPLMHLPCF